MKYKLKLKADVNQRHTFEKTDYFTQQNMRWQMTT